MFGRRHNQGEANSEFNSGSSGGRSQSEKREVARRPPLQSGSSNSCRAATSSVETEWAVGGVIRDKKYQAGIKTSMDDPWMCGKENQTGKENAGDPRN